MPYLSPARSRRLAHSPRQRDELPIGGFDPQAAIPAGEVVRVAGWAWPSASERVRAVEILVDGAPAGRARLTLRPDIAEAFDAPEAALSGFEALAELSPETKAAARMVLGARVVGMANGSWLLPQAVVALHAEEPTPAANSERTNRGDWAPHVSGPAAKSAPDEAIDPPERELQRLRLGFDAEHFVVLLEGSESAIGAGPAIAALDFLAERRPNLELIVAGVAPESRLADLIHRTINGMGLEDRVTLPCSDMDAWRWRSVADAVLVTHSGAAILDAFRAGLPLICPDDVVPTGADMAVAARIGERDDLAALVAAFDDVAVLGARARADARDTARRVASA